jgi:uncharacterized protein YjbI with pentapeptide repeats
MEDRLRSWWQKIQIHPVRTVLIALLLIIVVVLIILSILGYIFNWHWTGLVPETSEPKQHWKTLWDWLQLLIIPAVLAVAGYIINLTISRGEQDATEQRAKSEREAAEKRAETEREIALDNQREAALKEYIDKISELLLHENLRKSTQKDEVSMIARVQTLTVLTRLDSGRKRTVLQFLHESMLIFTKTGIIDLHGADLSRADLSEVSLWEVALPDVNLREANLSRAYLPSASLIGANLIGADLSEAYLYKANLADTNLSGANLRGADFGEVIMLVSNLGDANLTDDDLTDARLIVSDADLTDADLTGAKVTPEQLAKAKSLKGATMPDGSKHPEPVITCNVADLC